MHETFNMKVFTLHGFETYAAYGYRIDTGYLIVLTAEPAENNSVRLDPVAVFAPGGWLGYALEDKAARRGPIRFEFKPGESGAGEGGG